MSIVSAKDLVPEAPPGLSALCLLDRQPEGPSCRLYAVGDVGLCGHLATPLASDPWGEVGPTLRGGGIAFANLETPLVPDQVSDGGSRWLFTGPASLASTIAAAGFRIVNLANNHVADAGPAGISSTLEALTEVKVAAFGAGRDAAHARQMVVTDLGGLRIGWLGCARTLQKQRGGAQFWELDAEELLGAVERHRSEVEVLVVSLHLGYMFVDYPHPDHRQLALDLAATGADLVLAHHAHVVQGIELSPGGAGLCHNLGNFLFDWTVGEVRVDSWIEEQRCGAVLLADFDSNGLCRLAALPTRVDDDWVVRWQVGVPGLQALERLERISAELSGDYDAAFRRQRAERNTGLALHTLGRRLRGGDPRVVLEVLPRLRPHHLLMLVRWFAARLRR